LGDVDGDGYDDVSINSWQAHNWKHNVFYLGPTADGERDLWFGTDAVPGWGYTVRGHDLDLNGIDEIICWTYDQNSLLMFDLGPSVDSVHERQLFPPDSLCGALTFRFGDNLIGGDFNGDGCMDFAANLRFAEENHIPGRVLLYFGGADFDTLPDMIFERSGSYQTGEEFFGYGVLSNIGDANGDSHDDFFAASVSRTDSLGFVYFGGPGIDTLPDLIVYDGMRVARAAGDLNNDGYDDFLTSEGTESWGWVHVYLGGPTLDNVIDAAVNEYELTGYHDYFGREATGVGDVNGDGIDDFAVAGSDINVKGKIFIFAGWQGTTDVEYEFEPGLPERFLLHQNYPNPFNASTTIAFELPARTDAWLTIYNVLGQRIVTVLNRELSPGSYRFTWDGTNESGESVSSGVYFYTLRAGDLDKTKKMLLVK